MMETPRPPLLIDCRPFLVFNISHIRGAVNVNCCDRFNRRRLQQGRASLADLATSPEGKELLRKRTWTEVIVYDDSSADVKSLTSSHPIFLVLSALSEDGRLPFLLSGGFRQFQSFRHDLCATHLSSGSSGNDDTALACSEPVPDPSNRADIENHPATRVLPHLYLGNMRDAADLEVLERLGVRYVLNVTSEPPVYAMRPGIHYKQLEADDNCFQNLHQFFEEAFDFIDMAR
jgi:dual specificity MAP kinase phosphatase